MRSQTRSHQFQLESLESRRLISGTLLSTYGFMSDQGEPIYEAIQDRNVVIFPVGSTPSQYGLWRTDGTPEGTFELLTGPTHRMLSMGDYALFFRDRDLWRTDGTVAGTTFVKTVPFDSNTNLTTSSLVRVGDKAYFINGLQSDGSELYVTDGTAAGTGLRFESVPGPTSTVNLPFLTLGSDTAYFTVYNSPTQITSSAVYRLNPDDTIELVHPGVAGVVRAVTELNNKLIYAGNGVRSLDLATGNEEVLTQQEFVINASRQSDSLAIVNERLLYVVDRQFSSDKQIISTDGTLTNTMILDPAYQPGFYNEFDLQLVKDRVYFGPGRQIVTDGTLAGTIQATLSTGHAAIVDDLIYTATKRPGAVAAAQTTIYVLKAGETLNRAVYDLPWGTVGTPVALANGNLLFSRSGLRVLESALPYGDASGLFFRDANVNGVKDGNEILRRPDRLALRRTDGQPLPAGTMVTYDSANFTTEGLPDGEYEFYQTSNPDVIFTGPNAGRFTLERGVTLNLELGFRYTSSVSGKVIDDLNADGNLTETGGIPNVRVFLDLNDNLLWDVGEPNAFTNASGNYSMPDIGTVSGRLWAERPDGLYRTFPFSPGAIVTPTITSASSRTLNFGFSQTVPPTRVSGRIAYWVDGFGLASATARSVYVDSNDNGVRDAGEPSIEFTSPSSAFTLVGLPPGTHKLLAEPHPSYISGQATTITIVPGEFLFDVAVTIDRAHATDRSISGRSWVDSNRDGNYDPSGEFTNGALSVYIDENGNRIRDPLEPARVIAPDGTYLFEDVDPGVYPLRTERWILYSYGPPPLGDNSLVVVKVDGEAVFGADFALHQLQTFDDAGRIRGAVYVDYNNNGVIDPGEPVPLNAGPRTTIYTERFPNQVVPTSPTFTPSGSYLTQTVNDGVYETPNIAPGTWPIRASLRPWERMDTVPVTITAGQTTQQDLRIVSLAPRAEFVHPIAVPRPLNSMLVRFSEPVAGFDNFDLQIFRNGSLYTGSMHSISVIPQADPREFLVTGLQNIAGSFKNFTIGFHPNNIGSVKNAQGWPVVPTTTSSWTVYAPGDMNGDGSVNNLDIAPFVTALTNPDAYRAAYPLLDPILGDVNNDGATNNLDIAAFVSLLTGGRPSGPQNPTPTRTPKPAFADGPSIGDQLLEPAGGRMTAIAIR